MIPDQMPRAPQIKQSDTYDDDSFVNEDILRGSAPVTDSNILSQQLDEAKKFNNPIDTVKESEEDKTSSIPEEVKDEEDYDEYKDDEFERASQTSITQTNQITYSQSGLPPLKSGKINKSQTL